MTDYTLLTEKIRATGMNERWATTFVKRLKEDEEQYPVSDPEVKRWALERGFYPGRIELFGLNEANWQDYMADYPYSMLHPLNNHFLKWLDKTTLKYVLNSNGCQSLMPDYYLYIENDGSYTYLMDCPRDIGRDQYFLLNLLRRQGTLAMKPNSGTSGGIGFVKMELKDGQLLANNRPITQEDFAELTGRMRNYIVTEYCRQHSSLKEVWPDSECTLRVILCKAPRRDLYALPAWLCAGSFARFGTSANGGASNLDAGGVGVGFDYDTGEMAPFGLQYKQYAAGGQCIRPAHPDTGVIWKGRRLPHWDLAREMIDRLCAHISSLDYLGLDIILTEDGVKICEINSLPALLHIQVICRPVLSQPALRDFFVHKGLDRVDSRRFYEAYRDSQVL